MSKSIFQRPTGSAWTRDNRHRELSWEVAPYWRQGLDTDQITTELRRQGWQVTEAGVANALAKYLEHYRNRGNLLEAAE